MGSETDRLYSEYLELCDQFHFDVQEEDYHVLDYHSSLLMKLDVIETSIISIFDMYQRKHVFLSKQFETIFGYDLDKASENISNRYSDNFIHPEDLKEMLRSGNYFLNLLHTLPEPIKKNFKLIRDYRMISKTRGYVRVIEQMVGLELDRAGNPWLSLSFLDLSPDTILDQPFRCKVVNLETGDVLDYQSSQSAETTIPTLTPREKEVLTMVSEGLASKEIADKLFISVHTVNTHRQRIIEKLDVSNSAEAVKYAGQIGLLR